jgi:hypothetical protein
LVRNHPQEIEDWRAGTWEKVQEFDIRRVYPKLLCHVADNIAPQICGG